MTWNRSLFTTFEVIELPVLVIIANGSSMPCQGVGTVELHWDTSSMPECITIQNVRFMPDLNANLLSVLKLEDQGIFIASWLGFVDLVRDGRILVTAHRAGNCYVLELGTKNHPKDLENHPEELAFSADSRVVTWDCLHAYLAHIRDRFMAEILGTVKAFPMPQRPKNLRKACDPCQKAKQVKIISRTLLASATELLGRLYMDG